MYGSSCKRKFEKKLIFNMSATMYTTCRNQYQYHYLDLVHIHVVVVQVQVQVQVQFIQTNQSYKE